MKFYRAALLNAIPAGQGDPAGAAPGAPAELGGAVIAIRLADLVSPAGPAAKAGRGKRRVITGRNRHRDRKTKTRPAFPAAGRRVTTRTAAAQVSVCAPAAA